jgi:hypothetical protein
VTEYRPKDQATPSVGLKKGGPKRRTKREDPTTVSTALGNAANTMVSSNARVGAGPPPEEPRPAPQKRWPCLVRSQTYNSDYPTFCECLQPHCPHHSPAAKDILTRGCTSFSWPPPGIAGVNEWPPPAEPHTNCDTFGDLNGDPGSCEYGSSSM